MSDFSLTLVLRLTTSKIINDVAKVQINLRKSALLAEYFSSWTNLTIFCPLGTLGTGTVTRLPAPKKGINIINGQKVVMK